MRFKNSVLFLKTVSGLGLVLKLGLGTGLGMRVGVGSWDY